MAHWRGLHCYCFFLLTVLLFIGAGLAWFTANAAPEAVCTPDTADMVSYWPLDDGSGATTFDDLVSDPGNEGTCSGNSCPTSTNGKINTAFSFDGNDGIQVADNPSLNFDSTDSISFEMWVKTGQVCTGNKVFIGKYNDVNGSSWWLGCGLVDPADPLSATVAKFFLEDDDHNFLSLAGSTLVNDNIWHHIVAVRDNIADENRLYIDGVLDNSASQNYTGTFTDLDAAPVTIGYYINGYRYSGVLDEVAIYNRALTETEIQAHYNGGSGQSLCNAPPSAVDDTLTTSEDTPANFTGEALLSNDSDPDAIPPTLDSVATTSTEGGTIVDNLDGSYTYSPPADYNGTDTFTYTITDESSQLDTGTVTVTVNPVNDSPVITNPPLDRTNSEGDSSSLQVTATDVDGDTLTYSATNLPDGLSINPSSGLISGTITQTAAQGSVYAVTVTVTDGSASTNAGFSWTVNQVNLAPDLSQPQNQFNNEGDTVSLQLQVTNLDEDALEFTAPGLPSGLSLNASTGLISGTIAEGAGQSSPYNLTVTAREVGTDDLFEDSASFTWTVNNPPNLTNPGPQVSAENEAVELPIVANDLDDDILTFSAEGLPPDLTIDSTTGLVSGIISCTASNLSPYTITVTVVDDASTPAEESVTFPWTVVNVNCPPVATNPGDRVNAEGDLVSLQIQAEDPDGDPLTFSVAHLPDGLGINASTGLISGTLPPGSEGEYETTVTISDDEGNDTTIEFMWTVYATLERIYLPIVIKGG